MSDELKKVTEKIELTDEDLEVVAGGYSPETWSQMSTEERQKARKTSRAKRDLGMACELDDPTL